jgi:protein subunit release factor B
MRIPRERLSIRFARSGGPGGQNVNKLETKVEIRFRIEEADWIPPSVRERLLVLYSGRVTREGELVVVSSRHRTQAANLEDALRKLEELLRRAARRPKARRPTRPTAASREKRLQQKKRRAEKKAQRRAEPPGE